MAEKSQNKNWGRFWAILMDETKKMSLFKKIGSLKIFFLLHKSFGCQGKVLGIEPKKILRPDPGLYSEYFPSYAISCDSQFFFHFYSRAKPGWELDVWKFVVHKKCYNSETIMSTDLGRVSKFSLSLELFLWHPKA